MAILRNSLGAILVLCVFHKALTADYCDKSLCKSGKHIACENDGNFAKSCAPNAEIIKMTEYLKDHIVEKHNQLRSEVAIDKKARRMASIAWDDELAKMAELNVRQCDAKRDECHNTKAFPDSGQNVALITWARRDTLDQDIAAGAIQQWYNEYEYASDNDMKLYDSSRWTNEKTIEHYALVVNEAATHVGCAILKQTKDGSNQHIVACNYAANLIDGKAVYLVSSLPGSGCRNGRDGNYEFMCTPNEIYKRK